MVAIAKNLASHGSFANPFEVFQTGPTAANPPLYPLLLAILMKTFRLPALVVAMAAAGNIIMNALTASLLPRVSALFFDDWVPGVIAAAFWLASAQLMPAWDVSYTTAGLLIFFLLSASLAPEARRSFSISLWMGTVAGLLFLLNPASLLITVPWMFYLISRRRMVLKEAAILLTALTLIGFAWMARNHRQLGAYVARTNLGFNVYCSNIDCAKSSLLAERLNGCHLAHNPNVNLAEAKMLQSMGEVGYDHKRLADAKIWIETHPRRFAVLTFERFRDFWFPPLQPQPYASCVIWAATILSIAGLFLILRRRQPLAWFVLAVLLVYPLLYYIVASDVRYRYPVLWLSLLPAGYFLRMLMPQKLDLITRKAEDTMAKA